MTATLDLVEGELADLRRLIAAGKWPWSFFCYPEERPRPIFPSAFFLLAPASTAARWGSPCAVRSARASRSTSSRRSTSTFLPQRRRDRGGRARSRRLRRVLEEFSAELVTAKRFDARRLSL
jgi:hypothetical protein